MKILIAGDSWGCGEWTYYYDNHTHKVTHKGLEHFLLNDNHQVKNISIPGGSLRQIHKVLKQQKETFDLVFVFVTDTFRNLRNKNIWNIYLSEDDLIKSQEDAILDFAKKLNKLSIGQIYLLGGLCKVEQKHIANTGLKIGISSILELLLPEEEQMKYNMFECFPYLTHKNVNKKLLSDVYKQNEVWDNLRSKPIMNPDGGHPNRDGHFKIYEYVKQAGIV